MNTAGQLSWDERSFIFSDGSTKAQVLTWSGDSLNLVIGKAGGKAEAYRIKGNHRPVQVTHSTKEIHYNVNGREKRVEVYLGQGHYSQSSYKLPVPGAAGPVKSITFDD